MELFPVNVMELFSRVLGQNSSSIERVRERKGKEGVGNTGSLDLGKK